MPEPFEDIQTPLQRQCLLRARGISKNFSGVRALHDISFELLPGEVHALIGENGAGKSTFTKIVTGAIAADSGSIEICGKTVHNNNPNLARSLGVSAIYQQPSLFPHLSVAENIALALENSASSWRIDWKTRFSRAKELTDRLGAQIDLRRSAGSLSMAEQQIVEIAKAIGSEAKILFLDEPTALLSDREVANLFRIVHQLREQGVGMVYISHRLEEIEQIADRVTVLRDGSTIDCRETKGVKRDEMIAMMVGRSVASIFPKRSVPIRNTVLSVSNFSNRDLGLHDISFSVRGGEILGFSGLVGSGRTELAKTLFGMTPGDSAISIAGQPVHITSPRQAIDLGIGYLPEDRRQHGLIMEMDIASNITMASPKEVSRWGFIDRGKEQGVAKRYVSDLQVKTSSTSTPAMNLSGGNQQKVALARWLATKPQLMILDEPTQGVDVAAKAEIHHLISQMAEDGVAIILISSELPEILGMCDRVAVFHEKTIVQILDRKDTAQEKIMALAFGHSLDDSTSGGSV
ncbi:MAG: sugar ABC transporter ATP-binding protein [Acidobacteria bacterium]|nr:sugar ABC transporter ATP-binding protein [Acidobacteriota bacterium]